jgi:hypothetical protein
MRRILTAGLACLAISICAVAQTVSTTDPTKTTKGQVSGTNFPVLADYPGPVCVKAGELPKRPSTINNVEVDRYNALLAKYNKIVHDYVVCINLYVRNADGDMDLIRQKSRNAVEEANR